MLGIEDPYVWLAYVLCIASSALCVVYGVVNWNKGDEEIGPEDVEWAAEEKELQEEL